MEEEWQELKEEIVHTNENKDRLEEELGDLLFAIAQLARHLSIVPETALGRANKNLWRDLTKWKICWQSDPAKYRRDEST